MLRAKAGRIWAGWLLLVFLGGPAQAAAPDGLAEAKAASAKAASANARTVVNLKARVPGAPPLPGFYDLAAHMEGKHPLMKAAQAGLESFRAKLNQADWAYFPSFRLDALATVVPEVTGDALLSKTNQDRWGYLFSAKVTLVQPIYTFGKILSLRRAARQGVQIGRAAVDIARWELRYRLAQAWYGTLLSNEMGKILTDGKRWLTKAGKRMERLRAADSDDYDQTEHLRLKTRAAEFFALEADNLLLENQTQHGLRLLMGGQDPKQKIAIAGKYLAPLPLPLMTAEHYVALARKLDPGMRIKRATAKAKRYIHDHHKAQLLPDLVAVGEANLATSNVIERQPSAFAKNGAHQLGVGGGLALRWRLDVPQRVFKAEGAGALATVSEMDAQTAWQLTELKVRGLWQNLHNKKKLIEIFGASKKAAQGWLMSNWDLYEDGFGSFRDVMDALVQFYGKKIAYLKTIHDYNILVYELSRAVGKDLVQAAAVQERAAKVKAEAGKK